VGGHCIPKGSHEGTVGALPPSLESLWRFRRDLNSRTRRRYKIMTPMNIGDIKRETTDCVISPIDFMLKDFSWRLAG
jgi:hypothetical protein